MYFIFKFCCFLNLNCVDGRQGKRNARHLLFLSFLKENWGHLETIMSLDQPYQKCHYTQQQHDEFDVDQSPSEDFCVLVLIFV